MFKVGENLVDGLGFCGAKVVEGGSFLVGKVIGLFSDKGEENVMSWRENFKVDAANAIAFDAVGYVEDKFYQNTSIGKKVNDLSYMKYDSDTAKWIQNSSTKVAEITAATMLTVATGGASAPISAAIVAGVGFYDGVGKAAEKTIKQNVADGKGTSIDGNTLSIATSGVTNAVNWYVNGKVASGTIYAAGKKELGKVFSSENIKTALNGKSLLLDIPKTTLMSADDIISYVKSDNKDAKSTIELVSEIGKNYGKSVMYDVVKNTMGKSTSYYESQVIDSQIIPKIKDTKILGKIYGVLENSQSFGANMRVFDPKYRSSLDGVKRVIKEF